MPHLRLTHPVRPTLEFRQSQRGSDQQEAVANVAAELGTDRKPLVHIETKERSRAINGRVTAPRRAANDGDTSDWRQALANYVDVLESHVDEYQGSGYTLEDDIRDDSLSAVFHSVEWTLSPGVQYEIEFSADVTIGRGTFESRDIQRRNPTVDTSMDVAARVGGEPLPGLRQMQVNRSYSIDSKAVYDKDSAENNDIVAQEGPRQRITFEGTHTGSESERRQAEDALQALEAQQVTFETAFPGYSLDGYILGYDSNFEQRHGARKHHFTLQFLEGEPA